MKKVHKEMTFDDLIKRGVHRELDNIIKSVALKDRVYDLIELGSRWQFLRLTEKIKLLEKQLNDNNQKKETD